MACNSAWDAWHVHIRAKNWDYMYRFVTTFRQGSKMDHPTLALETLLHSTSVCWGWWSSNKCDVLGSRATSQSQHVKGHLSRSHGSITWSTILSDGVHRLIIGTTVMFEEEREEFLMSKLVRVVLDVRLSPSVGTRVGFKRSCSPCRLVGVRG